MSSSQMCASQLRFSSSAWLTSQKCAVFGCFRSTAFIDVGCTSKKLSKFLHSSNNTNLKSRCSVFSIFKHDLPRNIGWINSSSYRALHEMGLSDKPRGKINSPFVFWRSFTDTDIKGKYSEEQLEKQFETVASLEPEIKEHAKGKSEGIFRYLQSLLNQILGKKARNLRESIKVVGSCDFPDRRKAELIRSRESFWKVTQKSGSAKGQKVLFSLSGKQNNNNNNQHGGQQDEQQEPQRQLGDDPNQFSWQQLIPLLILGAFYFLTPGGEPVPETSWPVFYREMLSTGEVESLAVAASRDRVYVYLHNGALVNGKEAFGIGPHYTFTISSIGSFEAKLNKAQKDLGIRLSDYVPVKYRPENQFMSTVIDAMITIGILGLIWYILRASTRGRGSSSSSGGSPFNPFGSFMKARTTIIDPGMRRSISFKDVAGMEEAKQEIMEFVEYLQNPSRFTDLGAKIPKGALMIGPPGTGKTLLAKAVATEANVPFLTMAGSDFVEMFAGVGSARVRDLFAQARKRAPCIVYVDEVDAIGRSRRSSQNVSGNSEEENTLNQLLVEMDGINTVEGVVMLASTNRADILDQALLRPGRFDRMINIDLPTLTERKEIFEVYLKKLKLGKSLDHYSKRLAELTPGKSGADIANICNEAALHAARLNEKLIKQENFEYAVERVIAGMEKRSRTLTPVERRIVAYHEAGHAIIGWMLQYTDPVLKISIVPRTNSVLGYTLKLPLDTKLYTNEQLFDTMCMSLGGRVAEEMIFDRITTGAEDDLRKVTDMAYQQIVTYGMNNRVGPISFQLKKRTDFARKPYSDKLAKMIDEEASRLVRNAYEETKSILNTNRNKLEKLAESLLEKEVLNYDDLVELLGEPPYGDKREILRDKLKMDNTAAAS